MKTVEETYAALKSASSNVLFADFDLGVPVKVWVIESKDRCNHRGLPTKPLADEDIPGMPPGYFDGPRGLEWVLVEASSVGRTSTGISVTFWKMGATGWFPRGNCRLA